MNFKTNKIFSLQWKTRCGRERLKIASRSCHSTINVTAMRMRLVSWIQTLVMESGTTWVQFTIGGHAVGVGNCLKDFGELVGLVERWRHVVCVNDCHYWVHVGVHFFLTTSTHTPSIIHLSVSDQAVVFFRVISRWSGPGPLHEGFSDNWTYSTTTTSTSFLHAFTSSNVQYHSTEVNYRKSPVEP